MRGRGTGFAFHVAMTRTGMLVPAAALLLSACFGGTFVGEPGGDGTGDDSTGDDVAGDDGLPGPTPDAAPPADYAVALSPLSSELVLGETRTFTLTTTGENGFAGDVALSASGLPASWQVTIEPATVTMLAGTPGTATVTVLVPTDAEATTAMLAVTAQAAPGERLAAPADVTVKPELLIRIPQGSVDNPDNSFGPAGGTIAVRFVNPGTKVTWTNDDTVAHRIHADDVNGFNHQPNNLAPGASYSSTIEAPGTYDYNCHLHPQMRGRLVVMQGP